MVFRNQGKEVKPKKRFINDTIRSDFHINFMNTVLDNSVSCLFLSSMLLASNGMQCGLIFQITFVWNEDCTYWELGFCPIRKKEITAG